MCAPAAAALLLAALTALPCQGIDADATSRLHHTTDGSSDAPPTLNKVYLMLHVNTVNQTTPSSLLLNFQFQSSPSPPLNFNNNFSNIGDFQSNNKTVKVVIEKLDRVKKSERTVVRTDVIEGTVVPPMQERRKKPGDAGSSAPLLNYIFDTYSNTHQHRNDRAGNGNSIHAAAAPEVKALVGSTAHLDCKVDALHDKLVSWVRRKSDEEPMELLTTGTQQYTADDRYSARFIPPDIWRLEVSNVRPSDGANYDCQLSAHPPRTARVSLYVPDVSVRIVDGAGAGVAEQVCEEGSTVALRCEVRGLRMEGGPALLWYRRKDLLNDDTTRGGISVRTEFGENGANSVLRVARVRADDAGRYTCRVAHSPPVALPPADVMLHVIKGESLAELHQAGEAVRVHAHTLMTALTVALIRSLGLI